MLDVFRVLYSSRSVLRAVLIGLLVFAASAVAIRFTRFGGGPACLWFATAILIVELVLRPARAWLWPTSAAMIGGIVATGLFGIGFGYAPLVTLCTIGEAILAAWLMRRGGGSGADLGALRGVMVFIAVAGGIAPAVSGIGGAATIALATPTGFASNWLSWYLGHALGNLTLAPVALLALNGEMFAGIARMRWARKLEGVGLILATIVVTRLVFGQTTFPLLFVPLLPLMIAAFRFGRIGGAIAIVILATIGAAFTIGGNGPVRMISGGMHERVLFLQFYLATAVVMTLLIAAELNQRKRLMVALRASEARYRLIADGSTDVILTQTVAGAIDYASASILPLAGYEPAALIGVKAGTLVRPDDLPVVTKTHRDALSNPGATFMVEYCGLKADGSMLWCESHTRAVTDEDGSVVGTVSVIRDISRHKQLRDELSQAAQTDPLTGMVNRRAFDVALDQRLADVAAGRGVGVCAVLDLDFFKRVNDLHGHAAGDTVLCAFADVARRSLRADDIIARLGGEEFGLIIWNADLFEAQSICERLRREIADLSVTTGFGDEVRFTFSGGLAPIRAGRSRQHVLRHADEALYRAKHAGRNRLELAS
ncbi:diguanylate cyclase (GGDEF)-like protein/PAS domain S-box-containing protein [Sphingomonas sp. UYP23]